MMMEGDIKRCLTCLQRPMLDFLVIQSTESKEVANVLLKHFWFSEHDFALAVLCKSCWNQIDVFHRFYLSVQKRYWGHILVPTPIKLELDEESLDNIVCDASETSVPMKQKSITAAICEGNQSVESAENEISSSFTSSSEDDYEQSESEGKSRDHLRFNESEEPSVRKYRRGCKKLSADEKISSSEHKGNDLRCRSKEERLKTDEYIREHVKYICHFCGEDSPTFTSFQKHALLVHNERPAYVSCCDNKYYKKGRLYQHVQVVNNPDTFRCEQCQKNFTDNEGIKRHMREFHASEEDKKYKCDRCPKSFVGKYKYKIHVRDHDDCENKKLKCEHCEKYFKSHHTLTKHIKLMHIQPTDYICDICAMGFHSKTNFLRHREEHDSSADQKAQCDVCLRWFKSRQSVLRHKVEHEGPPNQKKQCEICLRWLKNRNSWRRHKHQHASTGGTCEICGHVSPNQRALVYHKKRMHSEVQRPEFECTYCMKTFAKRLTLKEHVAAQHTREILYSCPYCPKTSNSNANMYAHKKSAHPKEWWEERNNKFYKK